MNMLIILALILSIGICFLIPLGSLAYFVIKDKKRIKSFFIGILIFFITQIVIRLPLIGFVFPKMKWYENMFLNTWLSAIFLALTAGLVEEIGRYIAFKYILKNNRTYSDGIAFGFGHGGIEAILITGISCIVILIGILVGNGFNLGITATDVFIVGFERLCAMVIHIGLSIIVLYGVRENHIKYLVIAILIHTLVNFPIIILSRVFNVGFMGVEAYVFICAIILGGFTIYAKNLYDKQKLN